MLKYRGPDICAILLPYRCLQIYTVSPTHTLRALYTDASYCCLATHTHIHTVYCGAKSLCDYFSPPTEANFAKGKLSFSQNTNQ